MYPGQIPGQLGCGCGLPDEVGKRRDDDGAWDMQAVAEVAEERDLELAAGLHETEHDVARGVNRAGFVGGFNS